jgi:DNA-binding LytR/AlgR family response regulator
MTQRVLICEDEPLARETLRDFIAGWPRSVGGSNLPSPRG